MIAGLSVTQYKRLRSPHQPLGRWITPKRRLAIYVRDRWTCAACGRDLRGQNPRELSLDHLKPSCRKGGNESSNLVLVCRDCNARRGAVPWTRFYTGEARKEVERRRRRRVPVADTTITMALSLGDWTLSVRFCMHHEES